MNEIKVFISYTHDSEEHKSKVLGIAQRLREKEGIEVNLDQYLNGTPKQGWPRWMLDSIDDATHVLCVCTDEYYRRFRGHEDANTGKGADWEGAAITQELYDEKSDTFKYVPIILDSRDEKFIVIPLRKYTHYTLDNSQHFENLANFLKGKAGIEPAPLGKYIESSRKTHPSIKFDDEIHNNNLPENSHVPEIEISQIDQYAPTELIGREAELNLLDSTWKQSVEKTTNKQNILTLIAMGGEGKTSLVSRWLVDIATTQPYEFDSIFAWSFYSQGSNDQSTASADEFFTQALIFFGDTKLAHSPIDSHTKGKRLAKLINQNRTILFLDGLEPLQYPPSSPLDGELKDIGLRQLLKKLAVKNTGLAIITTRYTIRDLNSYTNKTVTEKTINRLSNDAATKLLKSFGVKGSSSEFEDLIDSFNGHALSLQVIGNFLQKAFNGNIQAQNKFNFRKADQKTNRGRAFRAIKTYTEWLNEDTLESNQQLAILKISGLFDRPIEIKTLISVLKKPAIPSITENLVNLEEHELNFLLKELQKTKLIFINDNHNSDINTIDFHPLIREFYSDLLHRENKTSFKLAHTKIYKHLKCSTKDIDSPTLKDLLPLYHAIYHGCNADLHQECLTEIYQKRILKSIDTSENYSISKLGVYGQEIQAISNFYKKTWTKVHSNLNSKMKVWIYQQTSNYLLAMLLLSDAIKTQELGTKKFEKTYGKTFKSTFISIQGEIHLITGELKKAEYLSSYEQISSSETRDFFDNIIKLCNNPVASSIPLPNTEKTETFFQAIHYLISSLTNKAFALNQQGKLDDALNLFSQALKIHTYRHIKYNLLYSRPGFQFNETQLSKVESYIQIVRHKELTPKEKYFISKICNDSTQHAQTTLEWTKIDGDLLGLSYEYLILSKSEIYKSWILSEPYKEKHINTAMYYLRRSGRLDYIPYGLLLQAISNKLLLKMELSKQDLDEAWEIAIRGPMRLFMADIHINRARLFYGEEKYPWESPKKDIQEARKLIEECNYWRRKEELEQLEKVYNIEPQ